MKRVLCLVHHDAEYDNRVFNEARSLQDAGYDVELCALEKRVSREVPAEADVPVARIPLRTRLWRVPKAFRALEYSGRVLARYAGKPIDVIHCHDLPTLPVGVAVSLLSRGSPAIVYDAHEYEIARNGLRGVNQLIHKVVERLFIRRAARVVTVSEAIGREYSRLYAIPAPTVVLNCPPRNTQRRGFDLFREEFGIRAEQQIFLYQGILTPGRGIEKLLRVFESRAPEECVIVFMGYGPLERAIIKAAKSHANIYFHEAVFPPRFLDYTASADFGISFIEDVSLSDRYCLPNKLFEYISVGLPVVCSNLPEMKQFVEQNGIGVAATSNTAAGLGEAIDHVLSLDYSKLREAAGRASELYNWETQADRLLDLYSHL